MKRHRPAAAPQAAINIACLVPRALGDATGRSEISKMVFGSPTRGTYRRKEDESGLPCGI